MRKVVENTGLLKAQTVQGPEMLLQSYSTGQNTQKVGLASRGTGSSP